jgi:hypothetical protein
MALKKDRNDIIEAALDLIGVKAAEEPATAADTQDGAAALDRMVKTWQSDGAHLWSEQEATLFVQPGQAKYQLGDNSPDHATEDPNETTLSAAAVETDTVITLTDNTGLLVGDNIGVELDSGSLFWTTVASLGPTTLTDALTGDAASENTVYFYTADLGKALKVPDARRRQSDQDIEMVKLGRLDYLNLPNKATIGTPVQFYYRPDINSGSIFLWPTPESIDTTIKFTYWRPLEVFADADDAPDFPNEWIEALIYNLAVRRAPAYGMVVPPEVTALAVSLKEKASDWDQEQADIYFQYAEGRGQ